MPEQSRLWKTYSGRLRGDRMRDNITSAIFIVLIAIILTWGAYKGIMFCFERYGIVTHNLYVKGWNEGKAATEERVREVVRTYNPGAPLRIILKTDGSINFSLWERDD